MNGTDGPSGDLGADLGADLAAEDAGLRTSEGIRRWRTNQGWSQARLAEALGNTAQAIKNWESGRNPAPHWLPLAIAELQRRHAPAHLAAPPPLTWFSPKVEKRGSGIEGTGLFARAALAAGEWVVMKGGHVMDRATRDRVDALLGPADIQVGDDLFIGPLTAAEREGSMMHLNHSCDPNVAIRGQIVFAALRAIAAGEELAFDYATGDDDDWVMDCRCGSAACRGTITGQDWRKPEVRRLRAGQFADYLERRIRAERDRPGRAKPASRP